MYTFALLAPLVIASSTLGATLSFKRDAHSACAAFSTDGVATDTHPFTLSAVFSDDKSSAPLSLGSRGGSGAALTPTGAGGAVVASQFILKNAGLIGLGPVADGNKTWISGITEDSGPFPFTVSADPSVNPGIAEDYCLIVPSTPSPASLGAHGSNSGWSICDRTGDATQQGVVFKAATTSADSGFDFATCRGISITVTPV